MKVCFLNDITGATQKYEIVEIPETHCVVRRCPYKVRRMDGSWVLLHDPDGLQIGPKSELMNIQEENE